MRLPSFLAALACLPLAAPASGEGPAPSRTTVPVPAQRGAIPLPHAAAVPDREIWHLDGGLLAVRNVTRPTLTPFLPTRRPTGAAVIVAPGGGFLGLAIEKEGWQVARWLADHGIAAFVLKYRVLPTPTDQGEFVDELARAIKGEAVGFQPPEDTPADALEDGRAALRHVRAHAGEYRIDPARVGFMGFSAGGFLTRSLVEHGGADMPAFAAPIYPAMTSIAVPADAPPMFVATAANDFLLARVKGFPLVDSYRAAQRPIEFLLLPDGGHGFGAGVPGTSTAHWLETYLHWLDDMGLTRKGK